MCWARNFIWTKITTSGTFSFCLVLSQFFERLLNEHSILCATKVLVGTEQKRLHCKLRYSVEKTGYACIQAPAKKFQNWKKNFKIRLSKTTFATLLDFFPLANQYKQRRKNPKEFWLGINLCSEKYVTWPSWRITHFSLKWEVGL